MIYHKTRSLLSAICLTILVLLTACTEKRQEPEPEPEPETTVSSTVSMFLDFGGVQPNKEIDGIPWQSGLTVYNAMVEAQNEGKMTFTAEEDSSLGHFITSIDDVTSNSTTFWLFCVNEVTSNTGVDETVLNDGDNVEWYYTGTFPPPACTSADAVEAATRGRGQHPQFRIE